MTYILWKDLKCVVVVVVIVVVVVVVVVVIVVIVVRPSVPTEFPRKYIRYIAAF